MKQFYGRINREKQEEYVCKKTNKQHLRRDDVVPHQHSEFLIQVFVSTHISPVPPLTPFYVRHQCLWRKRIMGNQVPLQRPRGTQECDKTHAVQLHITKIRHITLNLTAERKIEYFTLTEALM